MTAQGELFDDIAQFEYRMVPTAGDVSWNSYAITVSPKKRLAINHRIGGRLFYEKTLFRFFETGDSGLPIDSFEETHQIGTGIVYRSNFAKAWGLEAFFSPVITSNLKQNLSWDDVQYAGTITFSKSWMQNEKEIGFRFGLGYGALFGKPDFYPTLSVHGTLGKALRYRLGFPETTVYYPIGERHGFKLMLKPQGSYTNLSGARSLNGVATLNSAKLEYEAIDIGLEHRFQIHPFFKTLVRVGYLSENRLELLDNTGTTLNTFNTEGSAYITMGLTVNLNRYKHENNDQ